MNFHCSITKIIKRIMQKNIDEKIVSYESASIQCFIEVFTILIIIRSNSDWNKIYKYFWRN